MPQGHRPAQTFDVLLPGLSIAPPTRSPNGVNYLSGAPAAMGTLPAVVVPKFNYPSTCVVECVSPNYQCYSYGIKKAHCRSNEFSGFLIDVAYCFRSCFFHRLRASSELGPEVRSVKYVSNLHLALPARVDGVRMPRLLVGLRNGYTG